LRQFNSEIGDKKISDFRKYDPSISSLHDRMATVKDMILVEQGELHEFFSTYFEKYYISSPSQNGYLAEQDIVCKTLEMLGTYLLNAKDIESNRKVVYRFWKSQREFKQYKESSQINLTTMQEGMDEGVEFIDMLFNPKDTNYRLDDSQRLFARDYKEIEEIGRLQDGIDMMKKESYRKQVEAHIDKVLPTLENKEDIDTLKRIRGNVENYLNRWSSEMGDNQILIKEAIKRPIRFKNAGSSKGHSNVNEIELDDENVVKALIQNYEKVDLTSDIGLLVKDLDIILEKINLKTVDRKVVEYFKEGWTRKDIVEEMEIEQYSMTRILNRIGKRVADYYINEAI
jgi:hypothetical protein